MFEGLLGLADEDGDDEGKDTDQREQESKHLPSNVVTVVGLSNVLGEGEAEEPPDSPGEEVLDGEAPPELKDAAPPGTLATSGQFSHGSSQFANTAEEDTLVPLAEGKLGSSKRNNPNNNLNSPENGHGNPGIIRERKVGEESEREQNGPVSNGESHDSDFVYGSNNFASFVDPASTESLHDTEKQKQVDGKVVINSVEVGEAPVEAEHKRAAASGTTKDQGNQLAGEHAANSGVRDNSGGSLDHGEG